MIYTAIKILNRLHQIPHGFVNHTTWIPQGAPLVSQDRSTWDTHQLVPWTGPEPVWVELTINNLDSNGHPFHLVCPSPLLPPPFSPHPISLQKCISIARLRFLRPVLLRRQGRMGLLQPLHTFPPSPRRTLQPANTAEKRYRLCAPLGICSD